MGPDRLVVGTVIKPHGLRGEVVVDVVSDAPDRFAPGGSVGVGDPPETVRIRASRPHQGRMLVTFEGVPDRTAAESLRGRLLTIPATEARPLPEGSYYPHQLEGFDVVDEDGAMLGRWVRAMATGANDVWVIATEAGEALVPAIKEVVVAVDPAARRVVLRPMPGLFE